ncbi:ATP-binding protein [Polyangium sp. y55x31]|uniref:chemotaxis protein CheA n=1 Tax=Polyangium sp. y55x31 TaxID=3042688 RepID=UPI002482B102|nr:ATP-binding protein [Polyangium sp. y55x31]MDI1478329.1 ATP-binding protein [Polyangium sp. y55x31]
MSQAALPSELLARFRGVALERLDRVEGDWGNFMHGESGPEVAAVMQQELHTLKGEARMMHFGGLATLCHALEGLVAAVARRGRRVPEEVDLVVTMAIRFMVVMLRKKDAAPSAGMDVDGFVRQIEEVLAEISADEPEAPVPVPESRSAPVDLPDRVSMATQQRLAALAVRVFLEHVAAGRARGRLGDVVRALSEEVTSLSAVALAPRLAPHELGARGLAESLGKDVHVAFDVADVRVRAEVAESVEVVLLHALRNAVDHGIERPEARRAAGKSPEASIRVSARQKGGEIEISVEDDGAGVNLEAVRRRAIDLGLSTPEIALRAHDDELAELLFRPGLSTRTEVTDVSGRGIGLDAARAAIQRVGGCISISTRRGQGTTLRLRVPQASHLLSVTCFPARGADLVLAVATGPGVRVLPAEGGMPAIDPVEYFDMAPPGGARSGEGVRFEVRRGDARFTLRAGGAPYAAVATRLCPTADDCPAEIVMVDGTEVLLVRPEVF